MSEQAPKYGSDSEPSWLREDERERIEALVAAPRWDADLCESRAFDAVRLLWQRLIEARRELADGRTAMKELFK